MNDPSPRRPGPGRPSRAQQAERREVLLDTALDVFLDHGFDFATVEEIAARVGMSKRTVYALHADKEALFRAAVGRAIDRYTVPADAIDRAIGDDLAESLTAIARLRIANLATPTGIKLQRILAGQAYRFPDLFDLAFEVGAGQTVDRLAALFARADAAGEVRITDPRQAAAAYLSLAVGAAARLAVSGTTLVDDDVERHIAFAVDLFLNGVRRR